MKIITKLAKSWRKTFWNKVVAIVIFALNYAMMLVSKDATAMVIFGIISIGLFFAKENYVK